MQKDNLESLLKIKNATTEAADIYFYGDIVSSWWGAWDDTDQYPEAVKKFLDGAKGKSLNIYINSGGGSVFAGMAIYNMLKRHQGKKIVRVDGIAASIASVIALAGDEIIIPANAYFMMHKAWSALAGNSEDFLKMATTLEVIDQGIINAYAENLQTGVNIEKIRQMVKDETWMTGEEASQYLRVSVTPAIQAVAYAGELNSLKTPEALKNHIYQAKLNLLKLKGEQK